MYGHPSMPRHPYVLCSRYHCQRAGIRPSGQKEGHANGSTVVLECRSKKHLNTGVRVLRYILLLDGRSYGHAVWRTHRGHHARGAWGKCEGELRVRLVGVCTAAFTLLFCPKGQYGWTPRICILFCILFCISHIPWAAPTGRHTLPTTCATLKRVFDRSGRHVEHLIPGTELFEREKKRNCTDPVQMQKT